MKFFLQFRSKLKNLLPRLIRKIRLYTIGSAPLPRIVYAFFKIMLQLLIWYDFYIQTFQKIYNYSSANPSYLLLNGFVVHSL